MAQLGTIKLQTDSGIVDVPVFDVGDSGGSTLEALRVQTDSGEGFVPLVDPVDAVSPQEAIRVQTDSGVKAVTDSASIRPATAVHRWNVDEGSGTTLADSVGNISATISGANFVSGSQFIGGLGLDYDGDDDRVLADSTISTFDTNDWSFELWANLDNVGSSGVIAHRQRSNRFSLSIDKTNSSRIAWSVNANNIAQVTIPSGLSQFVGTFSGNGNGKLFVNATSVGSSGGNTDSPTTQSNLRIGQKVDGTSETNIIGDLFQVHNKSLSQSEVQDLFDSHPSTP